MQEHLVKDNFRNIYEEYFNDVLGFLGYLTRNSDEAEDLCQETFFRFLRRYGEKAASKITNPKSLLLKIAKNLFLNAKRSKRRFVLGTETKLAQIAAENSDFSLEHDWRTYITETTKFLQEHKQIYGVIFVLRVVKGLDFTEISRICGKTTRTIRRHMVKIRQLVEKFE